MREKTANNRQGAWVEALFVARATAKELNIARHWNPASRYDFLVEYKGGICRVQVKSCSYPKRRDRYDCVYQRVKQRPYADTEFDFVAVYVVPEDLWYVIPTKVLGTVQVIGLSPYLSRSKYYRYQEAWDLLRGRGGKIRRLEASADETGLRYRPCAFSVEAPGFSPVNYAINNMGFSPGEFQG